MWPTGKLAVSVDVVGARASGGLPGTPAALDSTLPCASAGRHL